MGQRQPAAASPWAQVAQVAAERNAAEAAIRGGQSAPAAPVQPPGGTLEINAKAVKMAVSVAGHITSTATNLMFTYNAIDVPCTITVSSIGPPPAILFSQEFGPGRAQLFNQPVSPLPKRCALRVSIEAQDQAYIVTFTLQDSGLAVVSSRRIRSGADERDLHDVYGLAQSSDCVVCLCEPSTTTLLPCGHQCLCDECAGTLACGRPADKKCPVCRHPFERSLKVQKNSS